MSVLESRYLTGSKSLFNFNLFDGRSGSLEPTISMERRNTWERRRTRPLLVFWNSKASSLCKWVNLVRKWLHGTFFSCVDFYWSCNSFVGDPQAISFVISHQCKQFKSFVTITWVCAHRAGLSCSPFRNGCLQPLSTYSFDFGLAVSAGSTREDWCVPLSLFC